MQTGLLLRVNGVLPDNSSDGACTSCSLIEIKEDQGTDSKRNAFHLLVDAGPGVAASLKKSSSELGLTIPTPDAVLITHPHRQQYGDLEALVSDKKFKI